MVGDSELDQRIGISVRDPVRPSPTNGHPRKRLTGGQLALIGFGFLPPFLYAALYQQDGLTSAGGAIGWQCAISLTSRWGASPTTRHVAAGAVYYVTVLAPLAVRTVAEALTAG